MPRAARNSCRTAASSRASHWKSAVPPVGARPQSRNRFSRCWPSRNSDCRWRCWPSSSCSNVLARARAGPLTAQGPSHSCSDSSNLGSASTKPRRIPARPKNLPKERSTTSPGRGQWPARLCSGVQSMKASSTSSQPPRCARRSRQANRASGARRWPVGLLGLTTSTTSKRSSSRSAVAASSSSSSWPSRRQAWACSA
ncbi:hypothetical protein D3C81_1534740 [compost metagenome]